MARFKHILIQSANGVKTITMNRPEKRNALCPLLIEELTLALREAEKLRLRRGDPDRRRSRILRRP